MAIYGHYIKYGLRISYCIWSDVFAGMLICPSVTTSSAGDPLQNRVQGRSQCLNRAKCKMPLGPRSGVACRGRRRYGASPWHEVRGEETEFHPACLIERL